MSSRPVATKLAWSFSAVMVAGLLLIGAVAYYELAIEPSDDEPPMQRVVEIASAAAGCVALLTVVGWWLARRALRPAEILAAAGNRIHEGNLSERIALPHSGEEFERLAEVFNGMTARLDASFQRVRQFTLYASHELKTPLSILRAEFERLVDDPARSETDREHFGRHLDEIDRLAQIVDGLTFLAKADSNLIPLDHEPVPMRPLVASALEDTAALGAALHLDVQLEKNDPVVWHGDRHRLRQLLVILYDNAIKYNRPGGNVTLSLEQSVSGSKLSVTNTGPGIPTEDHERVFQRFYRGSTAQSNSTEGCGLGLCIAQWIVAGHGGVLSFTSQADRTEFTMTVMNSGGE